MGLEIQVRNKYNHRRKKRFSLLEEIDLQRSTSLLPNRTLKKRKEVYCVNLEKWYSVATPQEKDGRLDLQCEDPDEQATMHRIVQAIAR